jgi:hypothetical protein
MFITIIRVRAGEHKVLVEMPHSVGQKGQFTQQGPKAKNRPTGKGIKDKVSQVSNI